MDPPIYSSQPWPRMGVGGRILKMHWAVLLHTGDCPAAKVLKDLVFVGNLVC
jgi:hypothetical protein